ncbi:MAG: hypothetical protein AAB921_01300 [Patescibacteria group bacterium]
MKKKRFVHRLAVRWKAFWRALDRIAEEYHRDRVAHPEFYQDLNQPTL